MATAFIKNYSNGDIITLKMEINRSEMSSGEIEQCEECFALYNSDGFAEFEPIGEGTTLDPPVGQFRYSPKPYLAFDIHISQNEPDEMDDDLGSIGNERLIVEHFSCRFVNVLLVSRYS
jgi:hypothetical protein